jgi:hypothetical protein
VYRICHDGHRLLLIRQMYRLLASCRGFIGDSLFSRLILTLLPATDASSQSLRSCSRESLHELMTRARRLVQWEGKLEMHDTKLAASETASKGMRNLLTNRWLALVHSAAQLAETSSGGRMLTGISLGQLAPVDFDSNSTESCLESDDVGVGFSANTDADTRLSNILSMALGCGMILDGQLRSTIVMLGPSMVKHCQVLFVPDIKAAQKSILLESRRYYFPGCMSKGECRKVDVGYYRFPLLSSRQVNCQTLSRRFAGWISRAGKFHLITPRRTLYVCIELGLFDDIFSSAKRSLQKLERIAAKQRGRERETVGSHSYSTHTEAANRLAGAISLWSLLNCGVLGEFDARLLVRSRNNPVNTEKDVQEELACAVCGVKNTMLSRCSRCRAVYYCSQEHQRRHWSVHKVGPVSSVGV